VATDGRPRAETTIDEGLVETLLLQQHPDLADLSVRHHGGGWDNEVFRLGERHAVRMPRRSLAAGLVEGELRWLPPLARRLPLLVPAPVRRGRPGAGYPWPWSITPWLLTSQWLGCCSHRLSGRRCARLPAAATRPPGTGRGATPSRTSSRMPTPVQAALACLSVAGTDPVLGPISHRTLGAVLDGSP